MEVGVGVGGGGEGGWGFDNSHTFRARVVAVVCGRCSVMGFNSPWVERFNDGAEREVRRVEQGERTVRRVGVVLLTPQRRRRWASAVSD